jgi:hypothetical protein
MICVIVAIVDLVTSRICNQCQQDKLAATCGCRSAFSRSALAPGAHGICAPMTIYASAKQFGAALNSSFVGGRRDLGARRRGRRHHRGSGNSTGRTRDRVRERNGHGTGIRARRVDAVATARIIIGVCVVFVVLMVPPVEMATAKASQRETRKDQESSASHQSPLPRVVR